MQFTFPCLGSTRKKKLVNHESEVWLEINLWAVINNLDNLGHDTLVCKMAKLNINSYNNESKWYSK